MDTLPVIQKIIELMDSRNLSAHKFETEAGLANASVQAWKNGKSKPSADALTKIADYFHVSVDYLLGRTDVPGFSPSEAESISPTASRNVTPDEDELLEDYRELGIKKGTEAQAAIRSVLKNMLK